MASILPIDASSTTPVRRKHLQRVRSTLDSIDRLGYITVITIYGIKTISRLHLGVVLRRYPYVRLFTFAYIVSELIMIIFNVLFLLLQLLLHVWVFFVLLTYKPEIHENHPDI